jgi:hypothetical protein
MKQKLLMSKYDDHANKLLVVRDTTVTQQCICSLNDLEANIIMIIVVITIFVIILTYYKIYRMETIIMNNKSNDINATVKEEDNSTTLIYYPDGKYPNEVIAAINDANIQKLLNIEKSIANIMKKGSEKGIRRKKY